MKIQRLIFAAAFLLASSAGFAQLREIGIVPFGTDTGTRALGMGAAFVGISENIDCSYYNPAGLAWTRGLSFDFINSGSFNGAEAYPTGYGSSFGLAIVNSRLTDIPISGGTASNSGSNVLLSYGTKLNLLPWFSRRGEIFERVSVGANLKTLFAETLQRTGQADRSAGGWDADLGILWKGGEWWSLGANIQNLVPAGFLNGGELHWDVGGKESVPAIYKLGGAVKIIGSLDSPIYVEGKELLLAGEMDYSNSYSTLLRVGGEFSLNKQYYLRAGAMQQWTPAKIVTNASFGLGWRGDEWGADMASYHEPVKNERIWSFSASYFPRDWVVIRKLDFEKPHMLLESAIEKISIYDNVVCYDENIEVVGQVKPGVEVFVNGYQAATMDNNGFKVTVPVNIGKNLLKVEARFESEKKMWTYKVLREAKVALAEEDVSLDALDRPLTAREIEIIAKKKAAISQNKEKVEQLVTLGIIDVSSEAKYKISATLTRGELASWLVKAAGLKVPPLTEDPFTDVDKRHRFAPYCKAVVDWRLMQTFPDGSFRPNDPVTRVEGERLINVLGINRS